MRYLPYRHGRTNRILRIDDVLSSLLGQRKWQSGLTFALIQREWAEIVGPEIAAHAKPAHLARGRLDVVCDHDVWRTELQFLKPELLARLNEALGNERIKEIWLK
jgi:predicted nucleic acid-binding Zn ribbon protein